jgi:N utilization substance protein A
MGQNARLAAKLTGYKIDIKSLSAAQAEPVESEEETWEEEDLPPLTDEDEVVEPEESTQAEAEAEPEA